MNTSIQALSIKSKLFNNPNQAPSFATKALTASGESLLLADPKSTRAMIALMDMGALIGGAASHFGGPSAFAELMSATHALMFHQAQKQGRQWHECFHFVNDAGHCENGLYALKANYQVAGLNLQSLRHFRALNSPLTGHGEAHLFPEGVLVSNGPLGSGLPQAQGLALADKILNQKRITICAISDGGCMEGEAREAFASIPGLARKNKLAPFVCIVSDNRTKLSGRIEQDAFSMEPSFQAMKELGWNVIKLEEAHQIQACVASLEEAFSQAVADPTRPVLIHAKTIKGKGVRKAEESSSGAHGFPLKKSDELYDFLSEIYEGKNIPSEFIQWIDELKNLEKQKSLNQTKPSVPEEKIQAGVAKALIQKRNEGLPVYSISADLQGSTGVAEFHKAHKDSCLDIGIAESNMISTAIGMSLSGFIPIVDTFAQFGVTKGALPLTMAGLSQGPVIGIFSHTGFQDAADGASHQALSFIAQVSSIPHVETYALSSSSEAEALVSQSIEDFAQQRKAGKVPPTRLFFLGRENFAKSYVTETNVYKLGKSQIVIKNLKESNKKICIVAVGSMLNEAIEASSELLKKGIGSIVINASILNKIDFETIIPAITNCQGNLLTLEEHRLTGGFGEILAHQLILAGQRFKMQSLAIDDHFGQSAYSAKELYTKHRLDSQSVVEASLKLLGL